MFVVGGSLGSREINKAIYSMIDYLEYLNLQVIWQCGKLYYDDYKSKVDSENIKLYDFIDQINLDKFESLKNSKKIPKAITKSQIDEIFNSLNNSKSRNSKIYIMVLKIMFLSGLRVSEALNLRWSDLNINDFSLNIYGKGSKERKVYLTQEFSKQLFHLKSNSIFIFHIKNKSISTRTINKFLSDSFKNGTINKSLSSHIFRHSFATTMLENNADIRHIQKLLGHSSISTTEIYTKVAKSLKKNVLDSYHPLKNKL